MYISSGLSLLYRYSSLVFGILILLQVILGIITVIMSQGKIPVLWGVLHQAGALCLVGVLVFIFFILRIKNLGK
jgi:cytochrome c oxidase assembly protein subunit 15